jgi:hypothetical protein
MFMARIERRQCPGDFTDKFVELGRLECQEHYEAGRNTITRWLEESGKDELILRRKLHVREKRRAGITRAEVRQILNVAFPVPTKRVSPILASQAARFLQKNRNGGWIVTRAPGGMWWVGSRKRTAAELVDLAKAKGFHADLSRDGEVG